MLLLISATKTQLHWNVIVARNEHCISWNLSCPPGYGECTRESCTTDWTVINLSAKNVKEHLYIPHCLWLHASHFTMETGTVMWYSRKMPCTFDISCSHICLFWKRVENTNGEREDTRPTLLSLCHPKAKGRGCWICMRLPHDPECHFWCVLVHGTSLHGMNSLPHIRQSL